MHQRRIGILRGGEEDLHDFSIDLGGNVLEHFFESLYPKWKPVDIFVDKENVWHMNGLPISYDKLPHFFDAIWNFSHPNYNLITKDFALPTLSHSAFNFALSKNRSLLVDHMKNHDIKHTRHVIIPVFQKDIDKDENIFATKQAKNVFDKFGSPWFVYPYSNNPNISPFLAKTFPELISAILYGAKNQVSLIVEEFINNKITEVHSIKNFRNENLYVLPVNYLNQLSREEKIAINDFHNKVVNVLSSDYYTKVDIVLDKRNKPYIKSISVIPDLSNNSSLNKALDYAGINMKQFIEGVLHKENML